MAVLTDEWPMHAVQPDGRIVHLELDPYHDAQGQAGIVDQDAFAALAAARLVPEHELTTASTMADQLLPLVE